MYLSTAACAPWTHILPAVSLQLPLYRLWLQTDTVAKNSVTEAQLWVLFVGQLVFLGWLLLLKKVQVRHEPCPQRLHACLQVPQADCSSAPPHTLQGLLPEAAACKQHNVLAPLSWCAHCVGQAPAGKRNLAPRLMCLPQRGQTVASLCAHGRLPEHLLQH